jgi:acyl-CoA synthetase (NDP forming)
MMLLPEQIPDETDAARIKALGGIIASTSTPILTWTYTCSDLPEARARLLREHRVPVIGGIELAARASGHLARWCNRRIRAHDAPPRPPVHPPSLEHVPASPLDENEARTLLSAFGVPMVPSQLVTTEDAAVYAAERLGLPVALKVCSPDLPHKSDVGGVALGLNNQCEVRNGYRDVRRRVGVAAPTARIRGVLVSPMREDGTELVVGVTIDPTFGPVLLLGLGGLWVEVIDDVSIRALPVDASDVRHMLSELRAGAVVHGVRGAPGADIDALVRAVLAITSLATVLGDRLVAVEVNPLVVAGHRVEGLDGLVVLATDSPTHR